MNIKCYLIIIHFWCILMHEMHSLFTEKLQGNKQLTSAADKMPEHCFISHEVWVETDDHNAIQPGVVIETCTDFCFRMTHVVQGSNS